MNMSVNVFERIKQYIGKSGITAFVATFVIGILTHMVMLTNDVPNHDGLKSMYSDQDMLVSGRWFLKYACGISSYFTIPWVIGILSLIYLGIAAIFLCRILEADKTLVIILISGVLVSFPSIASTFAYVFTMDGYMLGVLLAILSVYLADKGRAGFVYGGICLALSMAIYQAYLPIAMILSLYLVLIRLGSDNELAVKIKYSLKFVYMGVFGVALYYVILKLLLVINKTSLGTYQISQNEALSFISKLKVIYVDFVAFSIKGNILFANVFALIAMVVLFCTFLFSLCYRAARRKWYKSAWFYICLLACVVLIPLLSNVILIITPNATYHLLMRYQWAILVIAMIAFVNDVFVEYSDEKIVDVLSLGTVISCFIIIFSYSLSDNIAYSNLLKKYEKTYAYCLRLADRIEQTEGYYQGIPIYMIGVVGDDNYPVTDITEKVTGHMVGMSGDYLLYTGENYEAFFEHYMGISFNFLDPLEANYYDESWYVEMPSFPAAGSVKVVDGVLCVKTENYDRTGE